MPPPCRHPPEIPDTHATVASGFRLTCPDIAPPVRLAPRYPARMPVDYSGQDLSGRDYSGQDLSLANLSNANLRDAYLIGADLTRANLYRAKLLGANLTGANLTLAFRRPGISRTELEGAEGLDTVEGLLD